MGRIGLGYGSEWHLLRFLGRHRGDFSRAVVEACGGESIDWLDHPFNPAAETGDAEWKGLDFVPDASIRDAWAKVWPQRGNVQNWDAVGQLRHGETNAWLLVEAKAHVGEMASSCSAKSPESLHRIRAAIAHTKEAQGIPETADWESGYYQYANRLVVLHFLRELGVDARLLFLYFVGDRFPNAGVESPQEKEDWDSALEKQRSHLGLPSSFPLKEHVHELFLPVNGRES